MSLSLIRSTTAACLVAATFAATAPAAEFFVSIAADGSLAADSQSVTLDDLKVRFRDLATTKADADVLILADFDTDFDRFVLIITEAKLAGLSNVTARMRPENAKPLPAPRPRPTVQLSPTPKPQPTPTPTTPAPKPAPTPQPTATPTPTPTPAPAPAPAPDVTPIDPTRSITSDPAPTPARTSPTVEPDVATSPDRSTPTPTDTIDYAEWATFLTAVVDADSGRVDYAAARANRAALTRFLARVAPPQTFTTKEQRLAFGINAYNALVIKNVLDRRIPRNVSKAKGFFDQDVFTVAGASLTLNQIRDQYVRDAEDPRALTAIVSASKSAPPLQASPYRAADLNSQLNTQAIRFVNSPIHNNRIAGLLFISKIFERYPEDFKADPYKTELGFVATFAAPDSPLGKALRSDTLPEVEHMTWDWSLNQTR